MDLLEKLRKDDVKQTKRRGKKRVVANNGRRDVFGDEMTEEFGYFANHVFRSELLSLGGKYALVDMRTLAAIYEAAETGQAVSIA